MLILVLLLVLIVGGVVVVGRSRHHAGPAPVPPVAVRLDAPSAPVADEPWRGFTAMLQAWRDRSLIDDTQVDAIVAFEWEQERERRAAAATAAPAGVHLLAPSRRIPAVAEALGYIGGALAAVGLGLLVRGVWPDLGTPVRLVISGVAFVGLLLVGPSIRDLEEPAFARLHDLLLVLASAALVLLIVVVMVSALGFGEVGEDDERLAVVAVCATCVALLNLGLWWHLPRWVHQVLWSGAPMVALGVGLRSSFGFEVVGLGLVAGGLALLLGILVRPAGEPVITAFAGAAAAGVGAGMTVEGWNPGGLVALILVGLLLAGLAQWWPQADTAWWLFARCDLVSPTRRSCHPVSNGSGQHQVATVSDDT